MGIVISDEMRSYALSESHRRSDYIKHHFGVGHLTPEETDQIGFLGEFACCELLGIDWRENIRENYYSIDSGDITIINEKTGKKIVIDVKTETIPQPYFDYVLNRTIKDNEKYGRRLINKQQKNLLQHYNYVVFGGFARDNYDEWHPFGYLRTDIILNSYKVTNYAPFGGKYTSPALPIKTSDLWRVNRLNAYLKSFMQ